MYNAWRQKGHVLDMLSLSRDGREYMRTVLRFKDWKPFLSIDCSLNVYVGGNKSFFT